MEPGSKLGIRSLVPPSKLSLADLLDAHFEEGERGDAQRESFSESWPEFTSLRASDDDTPDPVPIDVSSPVRSTSTTRARPAGAHAPEPPAHKKCKHSSEAVANSRRRARHVRVATQGTKERIEAALHAQRTTLTSAEARGKGKTGYQLYHMHRVAELKDESNSGIKHHEAFKRAARDWSNMTQDERDLFNELATAHAELAAVGAPSPPQHQQQPPLVDSTAVAVEARATDEARRASVIDATLLEDGNEDPDVPLVLPMHFFSPICPNCGHAQSDPTCLFCQ